MSLLDPPRGAAGTVASSKMMLSLPLSWDGSASVSVNIASNRSRLIEIFRLFELTEDRQDFALWVRRTSAYRRACLRSQGRCQSPPADIAFREARPRSELYPSESFAASSALARR